MTINTSVNSSDSQIALASADSLLRAGVLALIIGFGGFVLWGSFMPIAKGVIASGQITVDGKRKTVQHLEGGIVQAIHVRDGDEVQAGDVLLELQQVQTNAQYDLLQVRYYTNLAILDRLLAEQTNASAINYSEAIQERISRPTIQKIVDVQNNLFHARLQQIAGQRSILEQRVSQLRNKIEGLEAEKVARQTEIDLTAEELRRSQSLQERGLIGMPRVWEQEKQVAQLTGAIGRIESEIAGARVSIGETELEIIQITNAHQQEIAEQSMEAQEQVLELSQQLASVEDVLGRTLIRAPQSGTVIGLSVFTVGGVIPPASPILDIVPLDDRLVIEAKIRATDVDNIEDGMPVRVQFVSLKQRTTPQVNGILETVSADALLNEQTQEYFYVARVGISPEEFARLGSVEVVPGMPVEVLIEAGSRTAFQYLFDPLQQVLRRSMTED